MEDETKRRPRLECFKEGFEVEHEPHVWYYRGNSEVYCDGYEKPLAGATNAPWPRLDCVKTAHEHEEHKPHAWCHHVEGMVYCAGYEKIEEKEETADSYCVEWFNRVPHARHFWYSTLGYADREISESFKFLCEGYEVPEKNGVWVVYTMDSGLDILRVFAKEDELEALRYNSTEQYTYIKFWEFGTDWSGK